MTTDRKEWQDYSLILKELLSLEYSPVGITCIKGSVPELPDKKLRICRAILDVATGQTLQITKENNACFGAGWHLGFHQIKDQKITDMIRKFVVEGEKLFCSYEALDNLISQMGEVPDNSDSYFFIVPIGKMRKESRPGNFCL